MTIDLTSITQILWHLFLKRSTHPSGHNHSKTSWVLSGWYYTTKMSLWSLLLVTGGWPRACPVGYQWTSIFPPEAKPKSGSQNKASIQADKGDSKDTTCGTNIPKFPVAHAPGTCPSGCCTPSPCTIWQAEKLFSHCLLSHIFLTSLFWWGWSVIFFFKSHMWNCVRLGSFVHLLITQKIKTAIYIMQVLVIPLILL